MAAGHLSLAVGWYCQPLLRAQWQQLHQRALGAHGPGADAQAAGQDGLLLPDRPVTSSKVYTLLCSLTRQALLSCVHRLHMVHMFTPTKLGRRTLPYCTQLAAARHITSIRTNIRHIATTSATFEALQHLCVCSPLLHDNKLDHEEHPSWCVVSPEHGRHAAALLTALGAVEPALTYGKWGSSAGAPTRTCDRLGSAVHYH